MLFFIQLRNNSSTAFILSVLCLCDTAIHSVDAKRNSEKARSGPSSSSTNYKDALLVYPTGIRSERDLPVCPGWVDDEEESKAEVGPSYPPAIPSGGSDMSKLQQPASTRNPSDPSSKKSEDTSKYMSACNVIHKRYFSSPIIERLCRCPDRTECPMEWSHPPRYKDLLSSANDEKSAPNNKSKQPIVSTTPSSKAATSFDPYTVMVSSRTQLKFCTEVSTTLPLCERGNKNKEKDSMSENPSMVKSVRKTYLASELTSISVNCYCPPLFHGWSYIAKTLPSDTVSNTTTDESFYLYRCDKLRRCKASQQCGTVRTDHHFSYYHCVCPKNHFCVPKVYPPVGIEDVIEEKEEALYSGQVAPAFCTSE